MQSVLRSMFVSIVRAIIIIMHLYRTVKIFSSKLPFPFKNYKFYKFFLEISARKRVDFMQLHLV